VLPPSGVDSWSSPRSSLGASSGFGSLFTSNDDERFSTSSLGSGFSLYTYFHVATVDDLVSVRFCSFYHSLVLLSCFICDRGYASFRSFTKSVRCSERDLSVPNRPNVSIKACLITTLDDFDGLVSKTPTGIYTYN
jgi:hypothetical protein